MRIDQQVYQEQRLVVLTLTGTLSDDGLLSIGDLIEQTSSIGENFSVLVDLRFADGIAVTTAGVRKMAARKLALPADSRRAVVVSSALGYGMARMYAMLRGRGAFRPFRDYDEARKWIETGEE